jgi:FkbM family methyltransferase
MFNPRSIMKVRLDVWEATLVVGFVAAILWRPTTYPNPVQSDKEIEYFRTTYGPEHGTEREEEWLIRDFFKDGRGGFFVDVGANHYRFTNKTFYLETVLGWSGLAIEPQEQYAADWARYRPRTKVLPLFVSNKSETSAELYVSNSNPLVASSNREFVEQFGQLDDVRAVTTITLDDLFQRESVTRIDFLSIDIELHEPRALQGLDLKRFRPRLVCIEGLLPVRQFILDYFAERGYVIVGKYMWVDRENLYFMPRVSTP